MGALVGETVGNYRITDLLGQGGMGVVYRAEHVLLGKRAAVKVLLPERCSSREIVDRFFNEAKASSLIEDPGIVDIFDFGRLPDGNAYIVMELLEGETLGDRLKRLDRVPASHAASIARHIAGTLAAAHAHGIIHRDLKPDNIFLVRDSALPRGERAKLLDFGIAKLQGGTQPVELVKTETGRLMGTPYYMSPEQCRGAGKIDQRTDIYSLGCVLYQMLTGRPPFVAEGAGEILAAHIHVPPLSLRTHEPSVPVALEQVALRMLEKDAARRYQTAEEVVEALNRAALQFSSEADAPEPSLQESGKHPQRPTNSTGPLFTDATTLNSTAGELAALSYRGEERRRLWPWIAGGVAAAAAGALVTMLLSGGRDTDAPTPAAATVAPAPAPVAEPAPAPTLVAPPAPAPAQVAEDPIVRALEASTEEETVRLMVDTRPEGATVYRESDGVRLGKTPLEVRARRGRGEAAFIVRRAGYRTERLALPVDRDQEQTVILRRGSSTPIRRPGIPGLSGTTAETTDGPATPTPPESGTSGAAGAADTPAPPAAPPADAGKKRGKDDALDPFNLLLPNKAKNAAAPADPPKSAPAKGTAEDSDKE